MSGERTLPGLGLKAYWTSGSSGYDGDLNADLRKVSAVVQLSVLSALSAVPGSPTDGDMHLITAGGDAKKIAVRDNGGWVYYTPRAGWLCWITDTGQFVRFDGSDWGEMPGFGGQLLLLARSLKGAGVSIQILEEEVALSGPTTDTTIQIPARSIALGAASRNTLAVTGATSYDIGVAGDTAKFATALSNALNSTNLGIISPVVYTAATPIRITANGPNFSGGKVRVTLYLVTFTAAST